MLSEELLALVRRIVEKRVEGERGVQARVQISPEIDGLEIRLHSTFLSVQTLALDDLERAIAREALVRGKTAEALRGLAHVCREYAEKYEALADRSAG